MNLEAFYNLSYGLYIISSEYEKKKNGYIANTVFQVTASPPQLAISCHKDNMSSWIIEKSGLFGISILHRDVSGKLLGRFGYKSGKDIDKFAETAYMTGETGIPIVTEDSIAWFECKVVKKVDLGTHLLFIGEVIDGDLFKSEIKEPITYAYYRKERKGLAPKNAPTYIKNAKKNSVKTESKKEISALEKTSLQKFECLVCGHIYDPAEGDPDSGIAPNTPFEDLPEDWVCPDCGAEKSEFVPLAI